jgi:hypothetical protein
MQSDLMPFDALTRVLTGLHEYTIVAADDTPNCLAVRVIATASSAPCPACGEFSTAVKAIREQTVRDVPHAGRAVLLTVVKGPVLPKLMLLLVSSDFFGFVASGGSGR